MKIRGAKHMRSKNEDAMCDDAKPGICTFILGKHVQRRKTQHGLKMRTDTRLVSILHFSDAHPANGPTQLDMRHESVRYI